jgi:outer membrane lipoprotein-sorting protein
MILRISTFGLILLLLLACRAAPSLAPDQAEALVATAWQTNQHTTWEIKWPVMPLGGPVTVDSWRAAQRYRYEILEAPAPALIGETLVSDGRQAWLYNPFGAEVGAEPARPTPTARLAPVSEAFAVIEQLLAQKARRASDQIVVLRHGPTQAITLYYENGDSLSLWRDQATGLPARIHFVTEAGEATLTARHFEPLPNPPDALFKPID